eukprot:11719-Heterococcus_DN1.PRE.2
MILYHGIHGQRGAPSTRSEGFMSRNGLPLQLRTREAPTQLAALDGGRTGVSALPQLGAYVSQTHIPTSKYGGESHRMKSQNATVCHGADCYSSCCNSYLPSLPVEV